MKTTFLSLLFLFRGLSAPAQQDTAILNRLNAMLGFTQSKNLEKVMDYTYPKLFTIAPRDLLIKTLKASYDTDEFTIELDSIEIDTIFPVFRIDDTSYVKVKHRMLMKMKYKAPFDSTTTENKEFLVTLMEEKYGKGKVRFDIAANSLNILMTPDIIGIKPTANDQWTFANLDDDNPAMLNMLFSKRVLDKLKEFK